MGRQHRTAGGFDLAEEQFDVPPPVNEAYRPQPLGLQTENLDVDYYGNKTDTKLGGTGHNANGSYKAPSATKRSSQEEEDDVASHDSNTGRNEATFRELVVYCAFLVVVCIIAFSMTSSATFFFTKAVNELFLSNAPPDLSPFTQLAEIDDVWTYFDNQLMTGLYWNQSEVEPSNPNDPSMVYYENRLLGFPRLRMLKVTNKSCEVVDSFRREIKECFGAYQEDREDRSDIPSSYNSTAFRYQSAEVLDSGTTVGMISTYGAGGYVQDLSVANPSESYQLIEMLKNSRWINRGSRVVLVDFSLYNANLNLFSAVKLILELPATGGVVPSYSLSTMKLIRYVSTFDYFVLVCEAIFCAFIIYYIVEEALELLRWRFYYFCSFWTYIDLAVIGVSCAAIAFSIRRTVLVNKKLPSLTDGILRYENMSAVVAAEALYSDCAAVLLFFAWIKVFKYISFNKTMNQLSATLSRSAKDIGGFAVMFLIFFFAYAQFGYLVFGTQIADYSTFYGSVFALLRTILGDFDFNALETANRILGPLFFITYVFFVFFVLLNMFLAIINDSYVEVKSEMKLDNGRKIPIVEFLSKKFYFAKRKVGLSKKVDDVDPSLGYDEWKRQLQKRGYSDAEINELYAKHDFNAPVNDDAHQPAGRQEKTTLNGGRQAVTAPGTHIGGYLILDQRVDKIEMAISLVADRVEDIVRKLIAVEERKVDALEYENRIKFQNTAEGLDLRKRPTTARAPSQ